MLTPLSSAGELVWSLLCTLLVTQSVSFLFLVSELAWFYHALFWWHTPWPFLTREWVGCSHHALSGTLTIAFFFSGWVCLNFIVYFLDGIYSGLSFFSRWVGLVFIVCSSGDTNFDYSFFNRWVVLVLLCTLLEIHTLAILFWDGELAFLLLHFFC